MRLNLIARFSVHARGFVVYCKAAAIASAERKRPATALKFNATCRNLSFAFYTTRPKSVFYAAKIKYVPAYSRLYNLNFTLRFAIFTQTLRKILKREVSRIKAPH